MRASFGETPRLAGAGRAGAAGLNHVVNLYPGLPRNSCTLSLTGLRMRLSSRKAARGSVVPHQGTGNPGPSWATFSLSCPN